MASEEPSSPSPVCFPSALHPCLLPLPFLLYEPAKHCLFSKWWKYLLPHLSCSFSHHLHTMGNCQVEKRSSQLYSMKTLHLHGAMSKCLCQTGEASTNSRVGYFEAIRYCRMARIPVTNNLRPDGRHKSLSTLFNPLT